MSLSRGFLRLCVPLRRARSELMRLIKAVGLGSPLARDFLCIGGEFLGRSVIVVDSTKSLPRAPPRYNVTRVEDAYSGCEGGRKWG